MTLIALDNGAKLSGLQRIVENDAQADADNEDNSTGDAGTEGNLMFKMFWGARTLAIGLALAAGGRAGADRRHARPLRPGTVVAGQEGTGGRSVLQLQQPGIEAMARQIAERPAAEMLQRAGPALQQPAGRQAAKPWRKRHRGRRAQVRRRGRHRSCARRAP